MKGEGLLLLLDGCGGRLSQLGAGTALLEQLVHSEIQEAGDTLDVLEVLAGKVHGEGGQKGGRLLV